MEWEDALELARRVTLMHEEETKLQIDTAVENTKAILKGLGVKGVR